MNVSMLVKARYMLFAWINDEDGEHHEEEEGQEGAEEEMKGGSISTADAFASPGTMVVKAFYTYIAVRAVLSHHLKTPH